jgi:predicted nucleic acid-binding protein
MSKVFVDTNVLVYSEDTNSPAKQRAARALLSRMSTDHVGVISTQVVQEFYVAATRKLMIDALTAKSMLNTFHALEIVTVDVELVKEAIDCSVLNRISFWDALIVVSAEKARCEVLWTEDLNPGQIIRGVRIENPFEPPQLREDTLVREESGRYNYDAGAKQRSRHKAKR